MRALGVAPWRASYLKLKHRDGANISPIAPHRLAHQSVCGRGAQGGRATEHTIIVGLASSSSRLQFCKPTLAYFARGALLARSDERAKQEPRPPARSHDSREHVYAPRQEVLVSRSQGRWAWARAAIHPSFASHTTPPHHTTLNGATRQTARPTPLPRRTTQPGTPER